MSADLNNNNDDDVADADDAVDDEENTSIEESDEELDVSESTARAPRRNQLPLVADAGNRSDSATLSSTTWRGMLDGPDGTFSFPSFTPVDGKVMANMFPNQIDNDLASATRELLNIGLTEPPPGNDVILGNERAAAEHAGTQAFRTEVHTCRNDYFHSDPNGRQNIVHELRQWVWNRGGQFVTLRTGIWIEMNNEKVDNMIRQRFLTEHDVIYGHQLHDGVGTQSFCQRVEFFRDDYSQGNDARQQEIVNQLTDSVQRGGGRFLIMKSMDLVEISRNEANDVIRYCLQFSRLSNTNDNAAPQSSDHDVIYGRNNAHQLNQGTTFYRELLRNHFFAYGYFGKSDAIKSGIVNEIRRQVRNKGGHFFAQNLALLPDKGDRSVIGKIRQGLKDMIENPPVHQLPKKECPIAKHKYADYGQK